jgi:adenylate kinase family enzyme
MIFCFCGTPLAGKTTMSRRFAHDMGLPYFSTGDLARSLGMGNEPSIKEKDLSERLDAQITAEALGRCEGGRAVIDGFPRSAKQFVLLDDLRHLTYPKFEYRIVFVMANPAVVFDRLVIREREQRRPEDAAEVVLGRLKRSAEWLSELQNLAGQRLIVYNSEGGYEGLRAILEASC